MKGHFVLMLSISTILFSACTSTKTLVINVEKPAELTLPNNVHNIVIVNNSVLQPEDNGHKALLNSKDTNESISVSTDSIDIILMEGIYEKIAEKNYFDNISLYPDLTRTDDNYDQYIDLSPQKIMEIAESSNSEAVISLDKVSLVTKSNSRPSEDLIFKFLDLEIHAIFRIYSDKGKAMSPPFLVQDSIFWVETRYEKELLTDSLPSRGDALKLGAELLSEKISKVFTPYWSDELRIYYGDVKEATKKMDSNDWVGARTLWEEEFNKDNKSKKKARIANNIALTYELTDNMKEAAIWAQTSCDLFSEEQSTSVDRDYLARVTAYKEILITRMNEFRILDLRKE